MIGHLTQRIVVSINPDLSGKPCVGLFNPDAVSGQFISVGTQIKPGETLGAALDRCDAFNKIGLAA